MNRINFNFSYNEMGDAEAEQCRRQLSNVRKIQATIYLERLSNALKVSLPVVKFVEWLGARHLTMHAMFNEYCVHQGWTKDKLKSVISLLLRYEYLNENVRGYHVMRTGQVLPLYSVNKNFRTAYLSVPFPTIQIRRNGEFVKQDAEIINRHIAEWYGGDTK